MSLSPFTIFIWVFLIFAGLGIGNANAASYDIKEVEEPSFVLAERVSISAAKVMNDVTDIELSSTAGGNTQRFIFQCDKTTESLNVFYHIKDSTGYKARGATGVSVSVYKGNETHYKHNGLGSIYYSEATGYNFQAALQSAADASGMGVIVFEFYEVLTDGTRSTIAYSQGIKTDQFAVILAGLNRVQGPGACDIDSGFANLSVLK